MGTGLLAVAITVVFALAFSPQAANAATDPGSTTEYSCDLSTGDWTLQLTQGFESGANVTMTTHTVCDDAHGDPGNSTLTFSGSVTQDCSATVPEIDGTMTGTDYFGNVIFHNQTHFLLPADQAGSSTAGNGEMITYSEPSVDAGSTGPLTTYRIPVSEWAAPIPCSVGSAGGPSSVKLNAFGLNPEFGKTATDSLSQVQNQAAALDQNCVGNVDAIGCAITAGSSAELDPCTLGELNDQCALVPQGTVAGTANAGYQAGLNSPSTATVSLGPPVNIEAPTVVAVTNGDVPLLANAGIWNGQRAMGFDYQWEICTTADVNSCSPVDDTDGAYDSPTYYINSDDPANVDYRVAVTATNAEGSSTVLSDATQVVATDPEAATAEGAQEEAGNVIDSVLLSDSNEQAAPEMTNATDSFGPTASAASPDASTNTPLPSCRNYYDSTHGAGLGLSTVTVEQGDLPDKEPNTHIFNTLRWNIAINRIVVRAGAWILQGFVGSHKIPTPAFNKFYTTNTPHSTVPANQWSPGQVFYITGVHFATAFPTDPIPGYVACLTPKKY